MWYQIDHGVHLILPSIDKHIWSPLADQITSIFLRQSSTNFTWFIIKCFDPNTVKPLNSGHLQLLKNSSVIERCPLLGGNLKKIVKFGTECYVRYSWHVRYLGCPLLGGFTVIFTLFTEGSIVHEETEFTVNVGNRNANVTAQIEGPEYSRPSHQVINNGDGTYTVRYRPDVVGTHRIYLNVNGQDLPGGPIETEVNQVQEVTETVGVTSQYEEGLMAFYFQCFAKFEKAVARRCSVKKLFLENFAKFTGKYLS